MVCLKAVITHSLGWKQYDIIDTCKVDINRSGSGIKGVNLGDLYVNGCVNGRFYFSFQ